MEGLIAYIKKGDTQPAGCVSPCVLDAFDKVAVAIHCNDYSAVGHRVQLANARIVEGVSCGLFGAAVDAVGVVALEPVDDHAHFGPDVPAVEVPVTGDSCHAEGEGVDFDCGGRDGFAEAGDEVGDE